MATVRIPPVLRPKTGGQPEVEAAGCNVGEVLRALTTEHPDTAAQLFGEDGDLNRYVNVYLNDEDVRVLDGLDTAVTDGDTVVILPAMAGGALAAAQRSSTSPRNFLVRSSRGLSSTSAGAPCSTITPPSMKTTWSPTSRAKPISWVTTIIVIPSVGELPHHVEHLLDQLRVERAGHLVEEHHVRVHRQRPGDRDPLLLAAGEAFGVLVELVGQADPLEQRRALLPASSRRPSTFSGAIVTFCRAVLWGKRLNCWKTIPTRWRTKSSSQLCSPLPEPGPLQMSWPSRKISPSSGGSSRLMQRSSVLLPEPLGPSTQTTSPLRDLEVDPPQHLELAEALVDALELQHRLRHGSASGASTWGRRRVKFGPARGRSACRRAGPAGRTTTRNMIAPRVRAELLKVFDWMSLPTRSDLVERDHADQGRVLHQRDEFVQQRRDDLADRLRDDHVAHRLAVAHPERARRLHLAAGHGFDPGPVDLRHVGAVDERQGDDAYQKVSGLPNHWGIRSHFRQEGRNGEAAGDQQDQDQQRDRRGRRRCRRSSGTAPAASPCRELAQQRQDQSPDQGQDGGDRRRVRA